MLPIDPTSAPALAEIEGNLEKKHSQIETRKRSLSIYNLEQPSKGEHVDLGNAYCKVADVASGISSRKRNRRHNKKEGAFVCPVIKCRLNKRTFATFEKLSAHLLMSHSSSDTSNCPIGGCTESFLPLYLMAVHTLRHFPRMTGKLNVLDLVQSFVPLYHSLAPTFNVRGVLEWVASAINFSLPSTAEAELQPRYLDLRKMNFLRKTDCALIPAGDITMKEKHFAEQGLGFRSQKVITEVQIGAYRYGALRAINVSDNEEILVCYFVDEGRKTGKFWITKFELAGKRRKGHKSYGRKIVGHLMTSLTNATKLLCKALNHYPEFSPPRYSIFDGPRRKNRFTPAAMPFQSSAEFTCIGFPAALGLSELSLLRNFPSISFTLAGIFDEKTPCTISTTEVSGLCDAGIYQGGYVNTIVQHALESRKQQVIRIVMGKTLDMLGLDLEQSDCSSEDSFLTDFSSSASDSVEGESQSNGMSSISESPSSGHKSQGDALFKVRKRKRDEDEEGGSKRPRYEASLPGCNGGKRKFACPYRKRFSQNDDLTTSCVHPFQDVHRVKEHLYRQHALSLVVHCARCFRRFKDSADLTKHLQPETGSSTCNGPRPQPLIYFGQSTLRELKRRSAKTTSEEEKWRVVWTVLFGDALDAFGNIPSPYSEDSMPSQSWTEDEFSRYEHFQRHTLPRLVQQHIARRLDDENPAAHIAEAILSSVPEIIRAIQEEHNYGRGNTDRTPTSEPGSAPQRNTAQPSTDEDGSMFFVPPTVNSTVDNTTTVERSVRPMTTPVEDSDSGYGTAHVYNTSGQPPDPHAAPPYNDALMQFPEMGQFDHPAQTNNGDAPNFSLESMAGLNTTDSDLQPFQTSTQIPSSLSFPFADDFQELYGYVWDRDGNLIRH